MKNLGFILSIIAFSSLALAQVQSVDLSGDVQLPQQLPAAQAPAASANNTTNVIVEQGQAQRQDQIQEQAQLPTTIIEASPLVESRAEQLRKQREAAELNTEMMIVEQLEKDRIEAERRRAQKLFGEKLQDDAPVAAPVVVEEARPYYINPQPQVIVEPEINQNAAIEEDISELKSLVTELKHKPEEDKGGMFDNGKFFISGVAGISEYNASNIKSIYALGLAAGMELNDGFIIEASYMNSSYDITPEFGGCYSCGPFSLVEMDQNSISAAVKYRILDGRISPIVGGIVSYTMRDYKPKYSYFSFGNDSISSQAIDLGLYAGAAIAVSQNFSVGLDLTYMFNLSNRIDDEHNNYMPYYSYGFIEALGGEAVEEINYYTIGINAAVKF